MQSKRGYGTHFAAPGAVTDSIMRENDGLGYPVEFMSYDAIVSSVNHHQRIRLHRHSGKEALGNEILPPQMDATVRAM